jgi:hypothetical protein
MQLTSAFLCDFAEVREGLLFALGGGITRLYRERYPAPINLTLAMLVVLEPEEVSLPHESSIAINDDDGRRIGLVAGGFNILEVAGREAGETVTIPIVIQLGRGALPRAGAYDVDISLDGQSCMNLAFIAKEGLPPNVRV